MKILQNNTFVIACLPIPFVFLYLYFNAVGLGITNDSLDFEAAARSLASGDMLRDSKGGFFSHWQPLYPTLLATIPLAVRHAAFLFHAILMYLYLWQLARVLHRYLGGIKSNLMLYFMVVCNISLWLPASFMWSELLSMVLLVCCIDAYLGLMISNSRNYKLYFFSFLALLLLSRNAAFFLVPFWAFFYWKHYVSFSRSMAFANTLWFVLAAVPALSWIFLHAYVLESESIASITNMKTGSTVSNNLATFMKALGEFVLPVSMGNLYLLFAGFCLLFLTAIGFRRTTLDRYLAVPALGYMLLLVVQVNLPTFSEEAFRYLCLIQFPLLYLLYRSLRVNILITKLLPSFKDQTIYLCMLFVFLFALRSAHSLQFWSDIRSKQLELDAAGAK